MNVVLVGVVQCQQTVSLARRQRAGALRGGHHRRWRTDKRTSTESKYRQNQYPPEWQGFRRGIPSC
jgi:hypothetical protein